MVIIPDGWLYLTIIKEKHKINQSNNSPVMCRRGYTVSHNFFVVKKKLLSAITCTFHLREKITSF